jgi:predicted transcriptional regulator of viral defense system
MPETTKIRELLTLTQRLGVLRARDLAAYGIPRTYLDRLRRAGVLDRPTRGVYVLADAEATKHHGLAEACKRVPGGVVCLLSALQFHGLSTQAPF